MCFAELRQRRASRKAEYIVRKRKNVCFTSGLSIWAIYQTAFFNFYHLFSMQRGNKFLSFPSFFWLSSFRLLPNLIRLVGTYEYWFVMGNEWFFFLFIGLSPSLHCSPAHIRRYYFPCSWFSFYSESFSSIHQSQQVSGENAMLKSTMLNSNLEPCWTCRNCEQEIYCSCSFFYISIYQK